MDDKISVFIPSTGQYLQVEDYAEAYSHKERFEKEGLFLWIVYIRGD